MDLLTQTDTYRLLKLKIEQIEVLKSEISIDNNSAKSIINIDIQFKLPYLVSCRRCSVDIKHRLVNPSGPRPGQ
jgi:uncharacterized metal-binding protein YceD (DUF177 family)